MWCKTAATPARSAAPAASDCPGLRKSVRLDLAASPFVFADQRRLVVTVSVAIGARE